jgi:hypothetical protein
METIAGAWPTRWPKDRSSKQFLVSQRVARVVKGAMIWRRTAWSSCSARICRWPRCSQPARSAHRGRPPRLAAGERVRQAGKQAASAQTAKERAEIGEVNRHFQQIRRNGTLWQSDHGRWPTGGDKVVVALSTNVEGTSISGKVAATVMTSCEDATRLGMGRPVARESGATLMSDQALGGDDGVCRPH